MRGTVLRLEAMRAALKALAPSAVEAYARGEVRAEAPEVLTGTLPNTCPDGTIDFSDVGAPAVKSARAGGDIMAKWGEGPLPAFTLLPPPAAEER